MAILMVVVMVGCGSNLSDTKETTVESGSIVKLDANQTIGYKPNSDVVIVNQGNNSYYVYCPSGDCPVSIGNDMSQDNDITTVSDVNNSDSHDVDSVTVPPVTVIPSTVITPVVNTTQ